MNSYLAKDPIHEIPQKSNYCSNVIKIYFIKELLMTEKDDENLRGLLNVGFVVIVMLMVMLE